MRIGIDVRKIRDGGIGSYIRETLGAFTRLRADCTFVAYGYPEDQTLVPGVEWIDVRAGKYSFAEHLSVPAAVARSRVDLLHEPHYVVPVATRGRVVVTIHDVIHALHPRSPAHRLYARVMLRWAAARAARVITVSETTARDLEKLFGLSREKVRVIPNGISPELGPLPEEVTADRLGSLGVVRPYVLFVGNWLPHKNVERLAEAWAGLPPPRPELVLCGRGFDQARELWRVVDAAGARREVRTVGWVDTGALAALYNGASLVALVSLYEGFGLPVVEAFACGSPVLGSNVGAIPEIAGDAAFLVSPHRVDMIQDGLYRLLGEEDLRKRLIHRGFQRVARYSWEAAARLTLAVYEEVRAESRPGS